MKKQNLNILKIAIYLIFLLLFGIWMQGCDTDDGGTKDADHESSDGDSIESSENSESEIELCEADLPSGTWCDPTTGLIWEKNVRGSADYSWDWAEKVYCLNLDLGGTGWRLPSLEELRSLIRGCSNTEKGGPCYPPNYLESPCSGCYDSEHPDTSCYWPSELTGDCNALYWSSTSCHDSTKAFTLVFQQAGIYTTIKDTNGNSGPLTRCVHDTF